DEALAPPAECDGLFLMPIEVDREHFCCQRMQLTLGGEFFYRPAKLVAWINLDQRVRPIPTTGISVVDALPQVPSRNLGEGTRKAAVFRDQMVSERENVHRVTPWPASPRCRP